MNASLAVSLMSVLLLAAPASASTAEALLAERDAALLAAGSGQLSPDAAVAHDRALLALGEPQRFGTQAGPDGKPLQPVSGSLPEALRADFLVPPLLRARDLGCEAAAEATRDVLRQRVASRMASPEPNARLAKLAAKGGRTLGPVHKSEVLDLLRADTVRHPEDFFHAASILSRSRIEDDLLLASELAAAAAARGVPGALALHAQAWDRWAERAGHPTRYGTTGHAVAAGVPTGFRVGAPTGQRMASGASGSPTAP